MKSRFFRICICLWLLTGMLGKLRAGNLLPPRPPDERIFGWTLLKTGGGWPCDPGAIWLNAGTSFVLINYSSAYLQSGFMPILVSADYSFQPHLAFGAYAGLHQLTYADPGFSYRSRLRSVKFGGRLLLHGSDLLCDAFGFTLDTRVIDIYAGIFAGIDRRTWGYENKAMGNFGYDAVSSTRLQAGLFFGVRYIFKQRVGVFAEAGRGSFGAFNVGLSLKIR